MSCPKRVLVIKNQTNYKHQIACPECGLKFAETTQEKTASDHLYERLKFHRKQNHSTQYWNEWVKLND